MKLFEIRAEWESTFYVEAESIEEARGRSRHYAEQELDELSGYDAIVDVSEVVAGDTPDGDWDDNCLIYSCSKRRVTLGEAWPKE